MPLSIALATSRGDHWFDIAEINLDIAEINLEASKCLGKNRERNLHLFFSLVRLLGSFGFYLQTFGFSLELCFVTAIVRNQSACAYGGDTQELKTHVCTEGEILMGACLAN